ncbi:deSI-like protein At4g17486 isoform X2 [Salvia hispanica]|uniref:deSI-like protein At4g17486 isoform X2 n=1 Tax=Salvia hispanica TaxID=49212 RepID=UPI00200983D0|nr:deSI-like protein At4g17486 isoform X2 [Salvia hispanica]
MLRKMMGRKGKTGTIPVYLNVYDLTPINGYAYWLGLGIYHSGVEVHGVEYAFGAHEHSTTGIFEVEPKHCPGFTFRKSILIARSDLGPKEVRALMENLAREYPGNAYNLISKNCNHFCNDVCLRLTGKQIPRWVNRLARLGLFCNCVLPVGINEVKVGHVRGREKNGAEEESEEKKKLTSHLSRYGSASESKPSSLSSASAKPSGRRRSAHSMSQRSFSSLPECISKWPVS